MQLKAGTRSSKLALIQTKNSLDKISEILPELTFEMVNFSSPGDRDRQTDLRTSDPNFFTQDLDEAILNGDIDCAIHSAKDVPYPTIEGIDWVWLPWREDPRDVIVLPPGKSVTDLSDTPVVGISSDRREKWCLENFSGAKVKPIRGNIDDRIAQLDAGDFDMVIMPAAALHRIGAADRINKWIPLKELTPPDGQGFIAVTFKQDNPIFVKLRGLFAKSVTFAGSGIGSEANTTLGTIKALKDCDVCLYDSLMPAELLKYLPATADKIDAGKRCGDHHMDQDAINEKITELARQSKRVVRLKGGDPGIFGRLAEEVEALDRLDLPYRVLPGVSSLSTASASTGILLTRRGVSRGFCVMTPRQRGGGLASIDSDARSQLPIVFFMASQAAEEVVSQLLTDGINPDTPAAIVYAAGTSKEETVRCLLSEVPAKVAERKEDKPRPAILVIGDVTDFSFNQHGALQGKRILLTCSEAIQDKAALATCDMGGRPVHMPLIKLTPTDHARACLEKIENYDWLVLTSPSSVRCLAELMKDMNTDLRTFPSVMVCGTGTANELKTLGIHADIMPESGFSASALIDAAKTQLKQGARILRLRSDKAGSQLAEALREQHTEVDDCILYQNKPVHWNELPDFDAVFFASSSAVEFFVNQWGADALNDKTILSIGIPTSKTLDAIQQSPHVTGKEATVESAISTLAEYFVSEQLTNMT